MLFRSLRLVGNSAPRVQAFLEVHPDLFQPETAEARRRDELTEIINRFSAARLQYEGDTSAASYAATRAGARDQVWKWMEAIYRTAVSQKLTEFYMPKESSQLKLLKAAHMFSRTAEAHRQTLIEGRLPEDFLEQYNAAVKALERSVIAVAARVNLRRNLRGELESSCQEYRDALERLDGLMKNMLDGKSALLAEWEGVRQISPRRSHRKKATADTQSSDAPNPSGGAPAPLDPETSGSGGVTPSATAPPTAA